MWINPSVTKYGAGYRETRDPAEIAEAQAAIEADKASCPSCKAGTPVSHNTGGVFSRRVSPIVKETYSVASTYQCRSGSRWYNPATKKMEGRAHCTCDYCW